MITFPGNNERLACFRFSWLENLPAVKVSLLKYAKYLIQQWENMQLRAASEKDIWMQLKHYKLTLRASTQTTSLNSERLATKKYIIDCSSWSPRQTPANYQFYLNTVLWASASFHSWKVCASHCLKDWFHLFIYQSKPHFNCISHIQNTGERVGLKPMVISLCRGKCVFSKLKSQRQHTGTRLIKLVSS